MTSVAAALLELGLTGGQIQLVVGDQDFLGRDLVEARQRRDRLAGEVHEGLRLQQPDAATLHVGARHQAVIAALGHQLHAQRAGDGVDPPEAGVVARGFVLGARVAEADEEFDHGAGLSLPNENGPPGAGR